MRPTSTRRRAAPPAASPSPRPRAASGGPMRGDDPGPINRPPATTTSPPSARRRGGGTEGGGAPAPACAPSASRPAAVVIGYRADGFPILGPDEDDGEENQAGRWSLAADKPTRGPGNPLTNDPNLARLCADLRSNSRAVGECGGRLLRLKRYLPDAGAPPGALDALVDALAANDTVEVLYLQNLSHFTDAHLAALTTRVLMKPAARGEAGSSPAASPRRPGGGGGGHRGATASPGATAARAAASSPPSSSAPTRPRVWAVNLGELPSVTEAGWAAFTAALPRTAVAFLYMSEHVLADAGLKDEMRRAARVNRAALLASRNGTPPPADLCSRIKNMWFNPGAWRERLVGVGGAKEGGGGGGGSGTNAKRAKRSSHSNKNAWPASVVAVPPRPAVAAPPPPPPPGAFLTSRQWAMREAVEEQAAGAKTSPQQHKQQEKKAKKEGGGGGAGGRGATSPSRPANAASPASPPQSSSRKAAGVTVAPTPGRAGSGGGGGGGRPPSGGGGGGGGLEAEGCA